jgi:hypothetical protein
MIYINYYLLSSHYNMLTFLTMLNSRFLLAFCFMQPPAFASNSKDEEEIVARFKCSDKGDLTGDDYFIRREFYMTGDGNCSLYSMGTTYAEAHHLFLENSNNPIIRDLAHQEIVDEFDNLHPQMKSKENYIDLKYVLANIHEILSHILINAVEYRQEVLAEEEQARQNIIAYAKLEETYRDYVNYVLIDGRNMLFRQDVGNHQGTYFIDALAYILNKNLIIWSQVDVMTQQILATRPLEMEYDTLLVRSHEYRKEGANETLEIIHRGNHFNRLVRTDNQSELEKAVEDERTSIGWQLQKFTEEKSQLQAFLIASANEEDIAQCYDAFILPFIKELALKGIVDGYYAKAPNWSSYAALKKALKSEAGVNFQDPVSLLRRYLPAAANPLFVQLEPKAGKEEAECQRIAVQQQRETEEQRQARAQQARQMLAESDLAQFYNGFAIPIMRDLVQQGRLHAYYITAPGWLSYEALRVTFPGADFSDPVVFFRTTANRHIVAVALEEALYNAN